MEDIKTFLIELGKTIGLYLLVVVGGTVVLLVASSFIGYLPYSDRPGPGWHGFRWGIGIREIGFFLSWAALVVIPGAVVGALLFLSIQLLQWIHAPRWAIATLGAVVSGFLSFYLIAAMGWYIALDAFPVYGAGVLGCVFGGWLLPRRLLPRAGFGLRQRLAVFAVWCLATGWLVLPYLTGPSCEGDQKLEIMFVQWQPSSEPLSVLGDGLTSVEVAHLEAAGVTGKVTRRGFAEQGWTGTGGITSIEEGRAVILMQRPLDAPVEVPWPDATSAIYIQETRGWKMIPSDARTLPRTIRLRVSKDNPAEVPFEAKQECGAYSGAALFDWEKSPNGVRE